MEHGVVDPPDQIVVDLLFGQFERRVEDGSHNGQGLGGDQRLAKDVRGRCRGLGAAEQMIGGVVAVGKVPTRRPTHIDLRDVVEGIDIKFVAGLKDGLANDPPAMVLRPSAEGRGESVEHQIGDGLAVVTRDTGDHVGRTLAGEGGQLLAQIVAPALGEFIQQPRRPIQMNLPGIVVKGPRQVTAVHLGERLVEGFEISFHRLG